MANEKNKEALDIVRQMVADGHVSQHIVEKYFPELAESENERIRKDILDYCNNRMNNRFPPITIKRVEMWKTWLEKEGEQKPVWSKEDEFHLKSIESAIEHCKKEVAENDEARYLFNEDLNWLKSLRPKNKWKPTEEQMISLYNAIIETKGRAFYASLPELYAQLKAL